MTVAVVATQVSTAATITVPAGAAVGDLAILFDDAAAAVGTPTDVVPAGWAPLAGSSGLAQSPAFGVRTRISARLLAAEDLGVTVTGLAAGIGVRKRMIVLRAVTAILGASAGPFNWQVSSGDPSLQTVTPPTSGDPVLVVCGVRTESAGTFVVAPAGTSLNAGTGGELSYTLYDYNEGPAVTTCDIGDTGNYNVLWSLAITITIALPPPSQFSGTVNVAARAPLGVFDVAALALLNQPTVIATLLARIYLRDGILRLHQGYGDLHIGDEVWRGVTDPGRTRLVAVDQIEEPRAGVASVVRITLAGVDSTFLRAMRSEIAAIEGLACDLLLGLWQPDTGAVTSLAGVFLRGRLSGPVWRWEASGRREFRLDIVSIWSGRNVAAHGVLSPSDQRRRYPDDTALDLLGGSVYVRWPIDET